MRSDDVTNMGRILTDPLTTPTRMLNTINVKCHRPPEENLSSNTQNKDFSKETLRQSIEAADKTESFSLYAISDRSVKPFTVDLELNRKPLSKEPADTGAPVSLISAKTFCHLFQKLK